jgi:hypothetical protein
MLLDKYICPFYSSFFSSFNRSIALNTCLTFGLPCKVKRFTEEDAKSIAKTVVNGRGERGVAVGWVDATEKLLKSLEDLVEYSKRTINP